MEMKEKFHGSCFGFICKAMASGQGNPNLQPLGLLAHEKDNLNYNEVFIISFYLHPQMFV